MVAAKRQSEAIWIESRQRWQIVEELGDTESSVSLAVKVDN